MITVTSINRYGYRIITEHAYRSSAEFERRLRAAAGHGSVCNRSALVTGQPSRDTNNQIAGFAIEQGTEPVNGAQVNGSRVIVPVAAD